MKIEKLMNDLAVKFGVDSVSIALMRRGEGLGEFVVYRVHLKGVCGTGPTMELAMADLNREVAR